jgi:hypothetical protein
MTPRKRPTLWCYLITLDADLDSIWSGADGAVSRYADLLREYDETDLPADALLAQLTEQLQNDHRIIHEIGPSDLVCERHQCLYGHADLWEQIPDVTQPGYPQWQRKDGT